MIEENKILEIIEEWNQYWQRNLIDRKISKEIIKFAGKEVIDIVGVRRSGKSSILALIIKNLNIDPKEVLFINFEEPAFVNHYSLDLLDKIWDTYKTNINPERKPYLFFDEIQLIPQWEKWVRKVRDLQLAHVFVTGSSSKLLSREFGTVLTGRHISFKIFPLSFKELLYFQGKVTLKDKISIISQKNILKKCFKEYLYKGGFPEIVLTDNKILLKEYFEDILYKDIVLRHEIRDVNNLRKLANFCLTSLGGKISYNSLKKTLGMSLDAIKDYLGYMEEAFLLFQVPIFSYSVKSHEYAPKKVYCIDNGLRNEVSFKFSKDEGKLAENIVFLKLKRNNDEVFYWQGRGEVDFVIKNKDNSLTAINVSFSNKINERETKSLLEFKKKFRKTKELILLTKDIERSENDIKYIPLWKWLLD